VIVCNLGVYIANLLLSLFINFYHERGAKPAQLLVAVTADYARFGVAGSAIHTSVAEQALRHRSC
jgi:hypothetical protein